GGTEKLLVHTHVGEGAAIDYAPNPPARPWTFQRIFSALPPTRTNAAQAQTNISTLLSAIGAFERRHRDARAYVVFRLAHATWATPAQARAMHDEGVEADVNLESNVATGAYPLARMPLGSILHDRVDPVVQNPVTNFQVNDLLRTLVTDPSDPAQVGGVLGNVSLKYLFEARVRCLLGTDADGVEHSDIVREYEYAASLIDYWDRADPGFRTRSGDADAATLFENVRWHRANMASDAAPAY
ncbi:MAG TPA: hypothetical protein VN909_00820, partial [Candidatus Dormibacteraeota bacterium]|nr:hypothetical protein [Candidatus Dormibacteraeota bacterium]